MPYLLLLIPIFFSLSYLVARKYIFSPLMTLSCAALVLCKQPIMGAALVMSAVGDWFMAHKGTRTDVYRLGILGFFIAHALFIVYATTRIKTVVVPLIIGLAMVIGYALYLTRRVLPRTPAMLKFPAALYAAISLAGFTCAMMTREPLYIIGIGLLLFSDTAIAENDFVHNARAGILILPTYHLCQLFVALSALIQ